MLSIIVLINNQTRQWSSTWNLIIIDSICCCCFLFQVIAADIKPKPVFSIFFQFTNPISDPIYALIIFRFNATFPSLPAIPLHLLIGSNGAFSCGWRSRYQPISITFHRMTFACSKIKIGSYKSAIDSSPQWEREKKMPIDLYTRQQLFNCLNHK